MTNLSETIVKAIVAASLLAFLAACSTTSSDILQVASPPSPLPSENYASIVVDGNSGKVLYQANADAYRYPASLTKMMTLYMLFDALQSGTVSPATEMAVSRHAASQAPSKLGLKAGMTIDVDSAINALAVKSANDVAATVAEHLAGSEEQFAAQMTARARSIGMNDTVFRNASGLPDDAQHTTARDMAVLGIALKKRFPQYFARFSQRSFGFRGRTINGHNRLLGAVDGVDGIKTGYIRASGYNIVTSVGRRGRRLVVVVMGGRTGRERDQHVADLIERFLPSLRGPSPATVAAPPPAIMPPADGALPGVGLPPADESDTPVALDPAAPPGPDTAEGDGMDQPDVDAGAN